MNGKTGKKKLGLLALVSIMALVLLICSVIIVDSLIYPSMPESAYERRTLLVDGVSYFPRQDVRVFLIMGIDREGPVQESGSYKNSGAADVVLVLIFDETAKEYCALALNRDTMVKMPVLGLGGRPAGSITAQLALSHTYGNGLNQSCENVRVTVSELLYGVTIHQYIALNMDVISILTDAVGGVRVNIVDDFSAFDDAMQKGEMVLNGDQAYKFIRTRKDVGDQLNISRMGRHEEFVEGFLDAFRTNIGKNISYAMDIYDDIAPYVVTDCSNQVLTEFLDRFYDYKFMGTMSPEGTNVVGEQYMEFYLDQEKFLPLILSLLYSQKNK